MYNLKFLKTCDILSDCVFDTFLMRNICPLVCANPKLSYDI